MSYYVDKVYITGHDAPVDDASSHHDRSWSIQDSNKKLPTPDPYGKRPRRIDPVDIISFVIGLLTVGAVAFDLICILGPIDVFPSRSFTNFDENSTATFTTRISSFQLLQSATSATSDDSSFYKIENTFDESKPNFPWYLKWDSESSLAISSTELATFSTDNFFNVTSAVRDSTFSWVCIKSLNKLAYILHVRYAGLIVRLVGEFVAVLLFLRFLILWVSSDTRRSAHSPVASIFLFLAGLVTVIGSIVEFSASGLLGSFIATNYCSTTNTNPFTTAAMKSTSDGEFWKQNFIFLGASLSAMIAGICFMISAFLIVLLGVRVC